jgi:hypothetical protein
LKDFLNATMGRVNVDRINVGELRERPTPVSQGNVLSRGALREWCSQDVIRRDPLLYC